MKNGRLKMYSPDEVTHEIFMIRVKEDISQNLMNFIRLCYEYALKKQDGLSTCQVSNINLIHLDMSIVMITGTFVDEDFKWLWEECQLLNE
jgi:hypothetical protein